MCLSCGLLFLFACFVNILFFSEESSLQCSSSLSLSLSLSFSLSLSLALPSRPHPHPPFSFILKSPPFSFNFRIPSPLKKRASPHGDGRSFLFVKVHCGEYTARAARDVLSMRSGALMLQASPVLAFLGNRVHLARAGPLEASAGSGAFTPLVRQEGLHRLQPSPCPRPLSLNSRQPSEFEQRVCFLTPRAVKGGDKTPSGAGRVGTV